MNALLCLLGYSQYLAPSLIQYLALIITIAQNLLFFLRGKRKQQAWLLLKGPRKNLSFECALCFCLDPHELAAKGNVCWRQTGLTPISASVSAEGSWFFLGCLLCSPPSGLERVKDEPRVGGNLIANDGKERVNFYVLYGVLECVEPLCTPSLALPCYQMDFYYSYYLLFMSSFNVNLCVSR